MITDRIGRRKVLLPINHNYNKICDVLTLSKINNTKNSKSFLASNEKSHLTARTIVRTFQLHRHEDKCTVLLHCPVSAEIRTVDSQSDLRIRIFL